jgi:tripartite-type tricarboxylate transporter receptor subunit TctC
MHAVPRHAERRSGLFCAGVLLLVSLCGASAAIADSVTDFYKGKEIKVVISAGPGGNYDLYSRLLIRHMVRFIPGHPSYVAVNMPGGSGLICGREHAGRQRTHGAQLRRQRAPA